MINYVYRPLVRVLESFSSAPSHPTVQRRIFDSEIRWEFWPTYAMHAESWMWLKSNTTITYHTLLSGVGHEYSLQSLRCWRRQRLDGSIESFAFQDDAAAIHAILSYDFSHAVHDGGRPALLVILSFVNCLCVKQMYYYYIGINGNTNYYLHVAICTQWNVHPNARIYRPNVSRIFSSNKHAKCENININKYQSYKLLLDEWVYNSSLS